MSAGDLALVRDGCIIGSTSPRLDEIDTSYLSQEADRVNVIDGDSHPPTLAYQLGDGRTVKLLARGYPLNFDGGPENIPADQIQITRALMLLGAVQAIGTGIGDIVRLDPRLQLKAVELFGEGRENAGGRKGESMKLVEMQLREAIDRGKGTHYERRGSVRGKRR